MFDRIAEMPWLELFVRTSLALAIGWSVLLLLRRHARWAIGLTRAMTLAAGVMPIVIAVGVTVPVAVLPQTGGDESLDVTPSVTVVTAAANAGPRVNVASTEGPRTMTLRTDEPQPSRPSAPIADSDTTNANGPSPVGLVLPPKERATDPFVTYRIMVALWASVATLLALLFLARAVRTYRWVRSAQPCDATIRDEAADVARRLGIRGPVDVRVCSTLEGPCTAGWFRPTVLLPARWIETISAHERKMVLAHELSHAAHRDAAWDAAIRVVGMLWWFHPLVFLLIRAHRLACEHRCDAAASQVAGGTAVFRRCLAQWALAIQGQRSGMLTTLAMADRSLVLRRLRWLKRAQVDRPVSARRALLGILGALVCCGMIATLRPVERSVEAAQNNDASQADKEPATVSQPSAVDAAKPKSEDMLILSWERKPLQVDMNDLQTLDVRVVDSRNQPIVDAKVRLGIITDASGQSASLVQWTVPSTTKQGVAKVPVPRGTKRVHLTASAPGYAAQSEDFAVRGTPEFKLAPGRIIKVRAVDGEGRLLPDAFPMLQRSRVLGREFEKQEDGTHESPVVALDRRWLRVADAGGSKGPIHFSELADVADAELAVDNGVLQLTVAPGVRLEGKLDESVPRPIKEGYVDLLIHEGEGHRIVAPKDGLVWQDYTRIQPDGSFVFPSLPPGAHAQLFALCNGHRSKNPTEDELREYLRKHDAGDQWLIDAALDRPDIWPQLVSLDHDVVNVTLPCQPTGALDLRVVDPAGNPISGAVGMIDPNGYFLGGELFIPCTEWSTAGLVRPDDYRGLPKPSQFAVSSFLRVPTDDSGIARFRNLPTLSDSYEVEAEGYVMAPYPTSPTSDPRRYGLVSLPSGKTVSRTITMEREVPRAVRELSVVYEKGQPLENVEVTVTDITTSQDADNWQQWSVQRFGPISRGQTNENGRVLLPIATTVDGQPVRWLHLHLKGRPERDVSFWTYVDIPTWEDGGVVRIVPKAEPPKPGALRKADAEYVDLKMLTDQSTAKMLERLVAEPNVVVLKQLLVASGFDEAEPLELKPDRNAFTIYTGDKRPIERVPTPAGERVIVLASVRPKGATWKDRPGGSFPPEAAFLFDASGELVEMLGGGSSSSGDNEDVMCTNLGTTGDFFVRLSASESHPPFGKYSRWYRISETPVLALTVHHHARGTEWSGLNGDSNPISEYGFVGYDLGGQDIDRRLPGVATNGTLVPRRIIWDGTRNRFIGPVTQAFESRPLYRVVASESAEFQALDTELDQLVVAGGRRDVANWHLWVVTVPKTKQVTARLVVRDAQGQTVQTVDERQLAGGQHKLQLQIDPDSQTDTQSTVVFMVDAKDLNERTTKTIPRIEIDGRPSVAGQPACFAQEPPARLFDKKLSDGQHSLVWQLD